MQSRNRNIANCSVFSLKHRFCCIELARLLLHINGWQGGGKLWFSIDRTNWKFGRTHHNLLVLAVQIGDVAVPLLWKSLGKAGNSACEDRIELIEELLRFFPRSKIAGLLGDREFMGGKWLSYLITARLPFVMRIKDNIWITLKDGRKFKAYDYLKAMPRATNSHIIMAQTESGLWLNLQAKRHGKEIIVVAFGGDLPNDSAAPINLYRRRWKIECGFQAIKRKGFDLECTHLLHQERLETLLALVVIAMSMCVAAGKLAKPPARKNHGYNANCLFTIGLKIIVNSFMDQWHTLKIPLHPNRLHRNVNYTVV